MSEMKNDQMSTLAHINQVAFRHFLEKGYEATSLKRIGDEVGIKSSSFYFYYKSKKELFLFVLNSVFERHLEGIKTLVDQSEKMEAKILLYTIFRYIINDCIQNSVDYKFKLRYRMFPAEEISDEIRSVYEKWIEKEYALYRPIFKACMQENHQLGGISEKVIDHQYRRFLYTIIYEILISGMTVKDEFVCFQWDCFWATMFPERCG